MIPRDLSTVLGEIQRSSLMSLYVATPGTVQSYDSATQTATIVMGVQRQVPDDKGILQTEEMPALPDVPVLFPRSTSFALTLPLAAGDSGLVVFCDRNIGQWRALGTQSPAADAEMLGLSGPVFIPGLFPDAKAWTSPSASDAVLGHKTGAKVAVSSTTVTASKGGSVDFVALAGKVKSELDAIKGDLDAIKLFCGAAGHVHTSAAPGSPTTPPVVPLVLTYSPSTVPSATLKAD